MDRVRGLGWAACVVAVWAGIGLQLSAGPPSRGLKELARRVEADPQKTYVLTDKHGPWMIFAASFAGEGAERDAQQLVLELRSQYNLAAYTHKQHYDFSKPVVGNGYNQYLEPKRMRYARDYAYDEVAVLVGDFSTVEDPAIPELLEMLKYARPKCLELNERDNTTLRYAGLRMIQRRLNGNEAKKRKGPLGKAFVTSNPLLPPEYFVPKGIDQFVVSMNKGVPHSLLDCPGKYSVRVATFQGNVIIDQKQIDSISRGAQAMKSKLHAAADKAHRLTAALRQQGIEAYEFHDRYASIVTVGHFESVGQPLPDGTIETDPGILRIMQAYGPRRQPLPSSGPEPMAGLQPRTLNGIPFDVQPWPIHVPTRSVAADYAQSLVP